MWDWMQANRAPVPKLTVTCPKIDSDLSQNRVSPVPPVGQSLVFKSGNKESLVYTRAAKSAALYPHQETNPNFEGQNPTQSRGTTDRGQGPDRTREAATNLKTQRTSLKVPDELWDLVGEFCLDANLWDGTFPDYWDDHEDGDPLGGTDVIKAIAEKLARFPDADPETTIPKLIEAWEHHLASGQLPHDPSNFFDPNAPNYGPESEQPHDLPETLIPNEPEQLQLTPEAPDVTTNLEKKYMSTAGTDAPATPIVTGQTPPAPNVGAASTLRPLPPFGSRDHITGLRAFYGRLHGLRAPDVRDEAKLMQALCRPIRANHPALRVRFFPVGFEQSSWVPGFDLLRLIAPTGTDEKLGTELQAAMLAEVHRSFPNVGHFIITETRQEAA